MLTSATRLAVALAITAQLASGVAALADEPVYSTITRSYTTTVDIVGLGSSGSASASGSDFPATPDAATSTAIPEVEAFVVRRDVSEEFGATVTKRITKTYTKSVYGTSSGVASHVSPTETVSTVPEVDAFVYRRDVLETVSLGPVPTLVTRTYTRDINQASGTTASASASAYASATGTVSLDPVTTIPTVEAFLVRRDISSEDDYDVTVTSHVTKTYTKSIFGSSASASGFPYSASQSVESTETALPEVEAFVVRRDEGEDDITEEKTSLSVPEVESVTSRITRTYTKDIQGASASSGSSVGPTTATSSTIDVEPFSAVAASEVPNSIFARDFVESFISKITKTYTKNIDVASASASGTSVATQVEATTSSIPEVEAFVVRRDFDDEESTITKRITRTFTKDFHASSATSAVETVISQPTQSALPEVEEFVVVRRDEEEDDVTIVSAPIYTTRTRTYSKDIYGTASSGSATATASETVTAAPTETEVSPAIEQPSKRDDFEEVKDEQSYMGFFVALGIFGIVSLFAHVLYIKVIKPREETRWAIVLNDDEASHIRGAPMREEKIQIEN